MTLADQITARLHGLAAELRAGSRVVVKIVEPCVCDKPLASRHQVKCEQCGGRGVIIDSVTIRPAHETANDPRDWEN